MVYPVYGSSVGGIRAGPGNGFPGLDPQRKDLLSPLDFFDVSRTVGCSDFG